MVWFCLLTYAAHLEFTWIYIISCHTVGMLFFWNHMGSAGHEVPLACRRSSRSLASSKATGSRKREDRFVWLMLYRLFSGSITKLFYDLQTSLSIRRSKWREVSPADSETSPSDTVSSRDVWLPNPELRAREVAQELGGLRHRSAIETFGAQTGGESRCFWKDLKGCFGSVGHQLSSDRVDSVMVGA